MSLLTLLLSCSGGASDGDGPKANPRERTLVIAETADIQHLLPVIYQMATDSNVINNTNLVAVHPEFDCQLEYTPELYESWTWNEEHTQLTVKVREGVNWSDGVAVTGEDVQYTYELIGTPEVASPRLAYMDHMSGPPVLNEDGTVTFMYTHAYDEITMLAHASMPPVAKHSLLKADLATLRGHERDSDPLVTGVWKIETWEKNQRIVLVPNPDYSGPAEWKPKLDRVVIKIIPEYATQIVELENGQIDHMQQVLVADADRLRKSRPDIELKRRGWRSNDYVAWNSLDAEDYKAKKADVAEGETLDWATVKRHELFGNPETRVALTKAINSQKLIEDLLTGDDGTSYGQPSVSTITPSLCETHNNDITPFAYDPELAKTELKALGWEDRNGNGILENADGTEFSFTLMTNSGNARRGKAAIIVQANLKDIGVHMEIEKLETSTFYERARKKDYDAILAGWSAGLFVDMTDIWHTGDQYEFNFTAYSNPEVDALIDAAINEPDAAKNNAMWKEAQALIYADQPYTFLYWMDEIVAVNDRFDNEKVDILSPYGDLRIWDVGTSPN
jgi:peptide/nickel transport system substrate-binding protein